MNLRVSLEQVHATVMRVGDLHRTTSGESLLLLSRIESGGVRDITALGFGQTRVDHRVRLVIRLEHLTSVGIDTVGQHVHEMVTLDRVLVASEKGSGAEHFVAKMLSCGRQLVTHVDKLAHRPVNTSGSSPNIDVVTSSYLRADFITTERDEVTGSGQERFDRVAGL